MQTHGLCLSAEVLYQYFELYMKTHVYMGASQFVGLILTRERNEKGR